MGVNIAINYMQRFPCAQFINNPDIAYISCVQDGVARL
jgi:hypothetical protein